MNYVLLKICESFEHKRLEEDIRGILHNPLRQVSTACHPTNFSAAIRPFCISSVFSLICIHYEMYLLIMSNIFPLATILQTFLFSADLRTFAFVWENSFDLYNFWEVLVYLFKLVIAVCHSTALSYSLSHYCSFVFVLLFIVWFPWIQTYFNNLPFFKLFGQKVPAYIANNLWKA